MSDALETAREIEALLFAAAGPLTEADLAKRLPEARTLPVRWLFLHGAMKDMASCWPTSPAAGVSRPPRTLPG